IRGSVPNAVCPMRPNAVRTGGERRPRSDAERCGGRPTPVGSHAKSRSTWTASAAFRRRRSRCGSNDELAKTFAPPVHRRYRTFRRVLPTAVEKDRLLSNPRDPVRPPKIPRTEMAVLTWEQATALADAHTERYLTLIDVAIDTPACAGRA